MKYIAIAQLFAVFAVAAAAPHKSHLRKLSNESTSNFLESKPEDERCRDGTWDCTCRDGSSCKTTTQCVNRGSSGSCSKREGSNDKSARMSCRDGSSCKDQNTACEDGSKCKERNGNNDFLSFNRYLDEESRKVSVSSKPEDERCKDGTWDCTCRDGSSCKTTTQCENRGSSGSCSKREGSNDKSTRMTCRDGSSCKNQNTACDDGSKCKERNGNGFLEIQ